MGHIQRSHHKRNTRGWGDGSAAPAALAEDLCSVFTTTTTITYNPSSRHQMLTPGLWGQLHSCAYIHTHIHLIEKLKIKQKDI